MAALRCGDGARRELPVDGEVKVKSRQGAAKALTIFFVEAEAQLYAAFELAQVLVGEVLGVGDAALPALLPEDLTAPFLPRNVARSLAHGELLRQALVALQPRRRQRHVLELLLRVIDGRL